MLGSPDNLCSARAGDAIDHSMTPERLRALVEATSDWIWEVDERGIYTFVSSKVRELLGYEPTEVVGRSPFEFMPPEEGRRVGRLFEEMVKSQCPFSCVENANLHKDGHTVILETSGVPMFREDGSFCGYRGIDRDITARKLAEAALHRAKQDAEHANRAKDAFLAQVSHELRAPLAPILSVVNVLEEAGELTGDLRDCVAIIRRNVEMQARLVDDLLDLSRIVQGKIELRLAAMNAHEQIDHVLGMCQADLRAKDLHLVTEKQATLTWVQADVTRFQQALLNVIRNAIKFTPSGRTITLVTRNPSPADLVIAITDTGQGIAPDALPHIFKPFEQGGRHVTRRFGGLGLGLAITRTIMELHGGSISAKSDGVGKGATFTLDFPTIAPPRRISAQTTAASSAGRCCRVLMVEDNPDTLNVMARLLRGRGHTVKTSASIAEALQAAAAEPFDLLISDIGLPDGSGMDLMQRLRQTGIRGIALSGFGMESDIQNSLDAGFHSHLTKPVDLKALLERIEAAMTAAPG